MCRRRRRCKFRTENLFIWLFTAAILLARTCFGNSKWIQSTRWIKIIITIVHRHGNSTSASSHHHVGDYFTITAPHGVFHCFVYECSESRSPIDSSPVLAPIPSCRSTRARKSSFYTALFFLFTHNSLNKVIFLYNACNSAGCSDNTVQIRSARVNHTDFNTIPFYILYTRLARIPHTVSAHENPPLWRGFSFESGSSQGSFLLMSSQGGFFFPSPLSPLARPSRV